MATSFFGSAFFDGEFFFTPPVVEIEPAPLQTAGSGADHAFKNRKEESEAACIAAIVAFLTSIGR